MSSPTLPPAILGRRMIHDGWSRFMVARVRLPDGTEVDREIEDHGSAVCVLPYDPERRVATLVRQFRPSVCMMSGETDLLEAPAGLREAGEDKDATARREVLEEAGLAITALELVVDGWSMPGVSTERMAHYLAPYRAADRVAAGGGLDEENEQITVVELPLADLAAMAAAGTLTDIKTLLCLMALQVRHPALFA